MSTLANVTSFYHIYTFDLVYYDMDRKDLMTSYINSACKNYAILTDVSIDYSICGLFSLSVECYSKFVSTLEKILLYRVHNRFKEEREREDKILH